MADTRQGGGLEINEDPKFERRSWTFERSGWVGMGLIIGATTLGLLGSSGPLNDALARGNDGKLVAEYDRTVRCCTPGTVRFRMPADGGGETALWLGREYIAGIDVEAVTPVPASQRVTAEGIVYVFDTAGEGEVTITFDISPRRIGWIDGRAGHGTDTRSGNEIRFRQFVYP